MAGINGIGNNKIDWNVVLNGVAGTGNVESAGGVKKPENLVLSETDRTALLNLLSAPELDAPSSPEDAALKLQGLVDKLSDGSTFNFTPEQTKVFTETLNAVIQKFQTMQANGANGAPQANGATSTPVPSTNTAKVMCDIYAMMALLRECAQEMKNAQREQRQAENSAVIQSIQNQADAQRTAALTGLIAGSIVCAIQVTATSIAAYKTISNTRAEAALGNEFNVNQSATELGQAQAEAKTAQTNLKTFTEEHPVPPEGQAPDVPEIAQQRQQLQAKVDETKAAVVEKRIAFESAKQQMKHSDGYDNLQEKQAWTRATFDLSQAFGNFGQTMVRGFVDLKQAEATAMTADQKKAEEALEQTKDMMASFQEVIDQLAQLAQAVLQAENESMRSAIQA